MTPKGNFLIICECYIFTGFGKPRETFPERGLHATLMVQFPLILGRLNRRRSI
jgi:hypothetical protein